MNPGSPRDLVRRGAERHDTRTAVISLAERLTYGDLAARTAALAETLKEIGVGPGAQVALSLPNSVAYLAWYFGVLEAGAVVVPLAPSTTRAEAEGFLGSAGIRLLVTPEGVALPSQLEMQRVQECQAVEGACLWQQAGEIPTMETDPWTPEAILTRQFSSGSTGRPKQMIKTEANVGHDYWHFSETLGLGDSEVFFGLAPLHHTYGAMSFLAAFHLGGSVSILPRFLPGPVLETARRDRPTVFHATPPMIEILGCCALSQGDEAAFRGLRFCIVSTGRASKPACDAFRDRFDVPVRVQYGSTETLSTTVDLDEDFEEGRVGRPYVGVEVGIFDDHGNPCAPRTTGNVGVRSPAASESYIGDSEKTAETFRHGFVFPGDLGYVDDGGRLHVLGRSDVINIGGDKVDRVEVEKVIRDRLPVKDVIVLEGRRAGLPVVRAVVEAEPARVTRAMVIEVCRECLSPHKVPAVVDVRDRLERDESGKVVRSSLEG